MDVSTRLCFATIALSMSIEATAQAAPMQRWEYEDEDIHISLTLGGKGHCAVAGVIKRTRRNFLVTCSVVPDSSGGRIELRNGNAPEPVVLRYVAADDSFVVEGDASRPLKRKRSPSGRRDR